MFDHVKAIMKCNIASLKKMKMVTKSGKQPQPFTVVAGKKCNLIEVTLGQHKGRCPCNSNEKK